MKVFVLGLDGATFTLIDRWLEWLPNFRLLMEQGVRSNLDSTIPPHTALAWPSIMTGVHPGKHGIYQFWKTQTPNYQPDFYTSRDFRYCTMDQLFNRHGLKAGMINIPMSHPPSEINGFMVTWPLSNTLRYSYPPNLVKELASNGGHYLHDLATMYAGQVDYPDKAIEFTKNRCISVRYLMQKYEWDLLFTVFTEIDRVSHYYWKYMDDKHPEYVKNEELTDSIFKIYKATDEVLGELIDSLNEETIFCVISDHGFLAAHSQFYIHHFLEMHGYVSLARNIPIGMEAGEHRLTQDEWYLNQIDWSKTQAYMPAPGSYGLNINLEGRQIQGIVKPSDYDRVRQDLIELLQTIRTPENNQPLFKAVLPREVVYNGDAVEDAPDLLLIPSSYAYMVHHSVQAQQLFGASEQNGLHDRYGVFIIQGPMFKQGIRLSGASVVDVLPTLLYAVGLSIPEDLDGHVLLDAFTEEFCHVASPSYECSSAISQRNESVYSDTEKQVIEERLRALGYL